MDSMTVRVLEARVDDLVGRIRSLEQRLEEAIDLDPEPTSEENGPTTQKAFLTVREAADLHRLLEVDAEPLAVRRARRPALLQGPQARALRSIRPRPLYQNTSGQTVEMTSQIRWGRQRLF